MKTYAQFLYGVPILLIAICISCGSSGSTSSSSSSSDSTPSAGSGTGNALTDVFSTWDTIAEVVSTSLNVGTPTDISFGAAVKSMSLHVHCTSGGPASVSGTDENGLFSVTADMADCSGTDGSLSYSGTYLDVGNNRTFATIFSGIVGGNGCLLTMTSAQYAFVVALDIVAAPTTETLTGSMTAACTETAGSATVSCDFGGGVTANNTSAFNAACSCSGAGCGS